MFRTLVLLTSLCCCWPVFEPRAATAESPIPPAPQLLPTDALAYVRIENADDMRETLAKSSLAQMLADDNLRPFVADFYQTVSTVFEQAASSLGLSLDELLTIPSGQVAAALLVGEPSEVNPYDSKPDAELTDQQIAQRLRRRREAINSFAGVLIVDAGGNANLMRNVLASVEPSLVQADFVDQTESIRGTSLRRFVRPRGEGTVLEWFERDNTFVVGLGRNTATGVLMRMTESATRSADETTLTPSLSENVDFAAVMSRSIGAEIEQPQVTFFANPYSIVRRIISRSGSAAFVWPIAQELGLEKIRGVGGSLFRGGDIVEGMLHFHIVIDPPRDGFFGVLRPEDVDSTPPDWVPEEIGSYTSIGWNFPVAFENLGKVIDRFAGEGRFNTFTEEPIQTRLGVSLKNDLFAHLTGRYIRLGSYERPAAWNSQTRLDAVEVDDPDAMKEVLAKVAAKLPPEEIRSKTISGFLVYQSGQIREPREGFRKTTPCLWVMDNYLVFADSEVLVERVIRARAGGVPRLIDSEDFSLMASELGAKLEGEKPFFISYRRDAESLRWLYELAGSPRTANRLKSSGENNPMMRPFSELMTRNSLPDFDTLTRYFNASGLFGYDEPGGMHIGSITLRPIE